MEEINWTLYTPIISAGAALLGAAIGGLFTLLVNHQNRKGDVDSWLRKEKLEIYNDILKFFREQSEYAGDSRYETDEPSYHNQIADLLTRAHLLSPKEVIESIENCGLKLLDYSFDADSPQRRSSLKSFRDANEDMRKAMLDDLKLD